MAKCVECGFLTIRHLESRQLVEPEPEYRECGTLPDLGRQARVYEKFPICFVRAANLREETDQLDSATAVTILAMDRECALFTPWHQGFTPKEHQEMLNQKFILEREERRDADQRNWQEMQEKTANKHHRQNLIIAIAGVVVGIATILAMIWGAGKL